MPIDPYSPCPGGTGKKVKFCCSDLLPELDKAQRMLEGEQPAACLDYVRKLDEEHPGRACLQSMRVSLEDTLGDVKAAEGTLATFLKDHPENAVAQAEKAIHVAAGGDPLAAITWLQKSIETCGQEMPARVYDSIGALAMALLSAGHYVPARAHFQLQLGISQARDERAVSALLQVEGAPSIAIPLKDMPPLEEAPADAAWRGAFSTALAEAQRGHWKSAAERWTALASQAGVFPGYWRNLATVQSYLGNYAKAVEALRKFAALDVPADDAIEAEALAQLLSRDESEGHVDELSVTYNVANAETVQEKLATDKRFERLPLDTSAWSAQNEPPPRAAYSLLDRAPPATGVGITREQVPNQIAQLLLFGKQTDREARLELILFRPELAAGHKLLSEALGQELGSAAGEKVLGRLGQVEHALSWHWRLPDDTPEELRLKLQIDERRHLVLERWPKLAQPIFGGRTPEQAAPEKQYRNQILAAIWLLEVSDADTGSDTYNALRKKLGLAEVAEVDAKGKDIARMPLGRLARLKVETLDDDQLKQAFNRAMVANYVLALRRLAPEVVKRPTLPVAEYKLSAYRMLVRSAASSAEALATIEEARKFAESQKQSSAPWDLMELSFRIQRGEAPAVMQLIDHIQRQHAREPGVAQALVQLLMQTGLIGPDGRMAVDMGAPAGVPGAAAEPGKLWTPDAPQAGGGEKKSALWLPD